jgi:hypothetical protein
MEGVSFMAKTDTSNTGNKQKEPVTTYHEKKIGKTLYRVTSVYKGEFELGKALRDLTVRKILRDENSITGATV